MNPIIAFAQQQNLYRILCVTYRTLPFVLIDFIDLRQEPKLIINHPSQLLCNSRHTFETKSRSAECNICSMVKWFFIP